MTVHRKVKAMDPPVPVLWACAAIFMAIAARQRGRSVAALFFLGLLLGPLAVVALLILPMLERPAPWPASYTISLTSDQKWWLSVVGMVGIYLVFLFEIWRWA